MMCAVTSTPRSYKVRLLFGLLIVFTISGTFLLSRIKKKFTSRENDATDTDNRHETGNNVAFALKMKGYGNPDFLAGRLRNCIASMCNTSIATLTFHIIADAEGKSTATELLKELQEMCANRFGTVLKYSFYDLNEVEERLKPQIQDLKEGTQNSNGMNRKPLYFFPIFMDVILPTDVDRVILLDADFYFQTDIKHLFEHFDNFNSSSIFGLARVQLPVYRKGFTRYRHSHPGTKVGDPSPDGTTGYNGGLIMIHLKRMRNSHLYKQLLRDNAVKTYAEKYQFRGSRAEQDFFVLLDIEHHNLFYILPCSWNRQLCHDNKKDMVGTDLFKLYHTCPEPIHAYHGNCRSKMPYEK